MTTNTDSQSNSARFVRGIGPKRAEALKRLEVQTLRDLCYFFPRRYEDRKHFQPIASVVPGSDITISGQVLMLGLRPTRRITIFEMMVGDESGTITAVWFNQPYLMNQFKKGDRLILSGKADYYQERLQLSTPDYELISEEGDDSSDTVHTGRITPIYPLTDGLAQRSLRAAMKEVVDHYLEGEVKEFLPDRTKRDYHLMDLVPALRSIHFPDELSSLEPARRRIIFDEFLLFSLNVLLKLNSIRKRDKGIGFAKAAESLERFRKVLPFELTTDQESAIREILNQVSTDVPMSRLLQGEVGSGKTMAAAFFLYLAVQNGFQSVLLVPTEILAEQHFQTLRPLFERLHVSTGLLIGSTEPDEKQRIYKALEKNELSVVIGTHALLQEEVRFKQLALVVVDEQHRFGVRQRSKLVQRNPRPHFLVMTATPIPRTLGLTLYGDLDSSVIRTLPKGRKPIKTFWISREKEQEVLEHVRIQAVKSNEQAYILFPTIEESENTDLLAATKEYERLRKGIFKGIEIGLVHGRLQKKERDSVMERFYRGDIKILVATSVIEVGVDNPNVTSMIIEHADRFGLSQLHQMRGRIGRGTKESSCFLFANPTSEEAKKRLRILTKTTDGFVISEEDLKLRGPGDFFGTKQSGVPFFQMADLIRDTSILMEARKEAVRILASDPELTSTENRLLAAEMLFRKERYKFP